MALLRRGISRAITDIASRKGLKSVVFDTRGKEFRHKGITFDSRCARMLFITERE